MIFSLFPRLACWFSARFFDVHDYPQSDNGGEPWHFYTHTCKHCGKQFTI